MAQMKLLDWVYLLIRLGYYAIAAYGLFLLYAIKGRYNNTTIVTESKGV